MSKPKQKKNTPSGGQLQIAVKQFRRNKLAIVGLIVLAIIVVACCCADFITPYDYSEQVITEKFAPVSWKHPFGTDQYGRDILTRILKGGQISLLVAFGSVLCSSFVGAVLGASAAFFGKTWETIVLTVTDILMSIPALLLAAAVSVALGSGISKSILAIAIAQLAHMVRIIYASALTVKNQEYLEAARVVGASKMRIIFSHVISNCLAPLIVQATSRLSSAITQIASLSFLGLGVLPPTPEWGSILNQGRQYIRSYWPIITFPGLIIALTLVSISFVGDGVRDALDPRLKR